MDVDSLRKIKHHGYLADLAAVNGLAQAALRRSQPLRPVVITLQPAVEA